MIEFILSDYVALLSVVLFVGSVLLLILVIKTILSKPKKEPYFEEKEADVEQNIPGKEDAGLSLIEAHLNVLSEEIKEIKFKLDKLIEASETKVSSEVSPTLENIQLLKEQLSRISTKLDAMYNVLSDLVKE
ncbi:MAG: hypothetical protein ACK4JE_04870 [Endomicrobiia bacterium]